MRGPLNGIFSAWLIGATGFNPLPAHTYCPKCRKIRFHREVHNGLDLPKELCTCGSWLNRDGHNLPFETYLEKVKANFCSVDCVVSTVIVSEAWREVLGFLQNDYTCDRYVFQQTEETGLPGQFSRLYLNPKKNDTFYEYIDEGVMPSNPEYYFDYEKFGRDCSYDGPYNEEDETIYEEFGVEDGDDEALGEAIIDQMYGGIENTPKETIERYIDVEKLAREMGYENTYVEYDGGMIELY